MTLSELSAYIRWVTYLLWRDGETASAYHRASIQWDHIPPVGKSKEIKHQHTILHRSNRVTYPLWVKNGEIPSAHNSATIQKDHILSVGEEQGDFHENTILHWSNKITYYLWAKNGEIPSANESATIQQYHVLSVGEKGRFHEHKLLHWSNKITYFLWVKNGEIPSARNSALIQQDHILPMGEKGEDPISTRSWIDPMRSHTNCRWNRGDSISTRFCNDPTRSRTSCGWSMGKSHEHTILQWSKEIAYFLWVENGEGPWAHKSVLTQQDHVLAMGEEQGDSISTWFCIDLTMSRTCTCCEWKEGIFHQHRILHLSFDQITYQLWVKHGEIPSAHGPAMIQRDRVPTVGEKRGDPMSTQFCINRARSRTPYGWKTGRYHEHTILHWSNKITYKLWVNHGEIKWAQDPALIQPDYIPTVGQT